MRTLSLVACALLLAAQLNAGQSAISDAEATQLAEKLETAANEGDVRTFDRNFDFEALLDTATAGTEVPAAEKNAFRTGVKQNLSMGKIVCGSVEQGGAFKLLRVRDRKGEKVLLFRLTAGGGVNYHEMKVRKSGTRLCAVDAYIYLAGEWLSQTLRRSYLPLVAHENRGLLDKLMSNESEYMKNLPQLSAMGEALRNGQKAKGLKIYYQLPAALQQDKNVLIQRIALASQHDEKEYSLAAADFEKFHAGDPALHLILIDAHFFAKRFDKAQKSIDQVDAAVGGDPYLNVLRANLYCVAGDTAAAKVAIIKAETAEPKMSQAFLTHLLITVKDKDYAQSVKLLNKLENELGVELADLRTVPDYADFVKATEYAAWMKSRPKK